MPAHEAPAELKHAQPVKVDNRKVALIGTALWVIALLVVAGLKVFTSIDTGLALWVCVAGVALGGVGLIDLVRRSRTGYQGNR